jgi:predicted MFS family arabinose efflux permease
MAGGVAFGSPLGAMLVPLIGWRGLFVVVGFAGAALLLVLLCTYRKLRPTVLVVQATEDG